MLAPRSPNSSRKNCQGVLTPLSDVGKTYPLRLTETVGWLGEKTVPLSLPYASVPWCKAPFPSRTKWAVRKLETDQGISWGPGMLGNNS